MKSIIRKLFKLTIVAIGGLTVHDYTLQRTPQPAAIPICPEVTSDNFNCSSNWLSQIMGYPIDKFDIKFVGGGFTTKSYRVNLQGENPTSMFVKYLVKDKNEPPWMAALSNIFGAGIESISRKEVFFYKHLRDVFAKNGIQTPKSYYAEAEDFGDRSFLFTLLGFTSGYRGVLCLQDLGKHESYSTGHLYNERHALFVAKKLAQLHALNWNTPIHPELPTFKSDLYTAMFNLIDYLPKFPKKQDYVSKRIDVFKSHHFFNYLSNPNIRDALLTFTDQHVKLHKYFSNNVQSGLLFQHKTFLHGDFHPGNIFFINEASPKNPQMKEIKDIVLCDWQGYGYGNPSTEFSYFLSNVEFDPERDQKIMKVYYEELIKTVPKEVYPWKVFEREVDIRTMGLVSSMFRNTASMSPESIPQMRELFMKRGFDWDRLMVSFGPKFLRFSHVVQKWNNDDIFNRIEDVKV